LISLVEDKSSHFWVKRKKFSQKFGGVSEVSYKVALMIKEKRALKAFCKKSKASFANGHRDLQSGCTSENGCEFASRNCDCD
jgi:hypothetical protein